MRTTEVWRTPPLLTGPGTYKCHPNAIETTAFVRVYFPHFMNSLSHHAGFYWSPKFLLPYIKQCHIIAACVSVKVARPL